jgi:hypothetical protein
MIWSYCQPVDLLQRERRFGRVYFSLKDRRHSVCRTSRALRLYLTTKTAEAIWITSRENMSVVAQRHWHCYDGYYDEDSDVHYGPYDTQPWPRTYAIPPPPPYLNEIVSRVRLIRHR